MGARKIVAAIALSAAASAAPAVDAKQKPIEPITLPAPKDFASAIDAIERVTGAKAQALETSAGVVPSGEGRGFSVSSHLVEQLLAGSHTAFRRAGFYLFRYERAFGVAGEKDRLGLLATGDRSAVVRRIGTSSAHHDVTTDQIVSWLDELAKEEPFELTEIGADFLAGRFERAPKDPVAIAERSAAFAPDLVAGRASTLALLAEEIRANRTLYLIW